MVNDDLHSLGPFEFLATIDLPIFVLDLHAHPNTTPIFQTASLRKLQAIRGNLLKIGGKEARNDPTNAAFLQWAVSSPQASTLPPSAYWGIQWTGRNVRNRWRIIVGEVGSLSRDDTCLAERSCQNETRIPPQKGPEPSQSQAQSLPQKSPKRPPLQIKASPIPQETPQTRLKASTSHSDESISTFALRSPKGTSFEDYVSRQHNTEHCGLFDITEHESKKSICPHLNFFMGFDWASTELGAISSWSTDLCRMVNILLNDPRPAAMYCGESKTMMYNESYLLVAGEKHPGLMGKFFPEAWAEMHEEFVPAFEKAAETGTSLIIDDACFYIARDGYLEECYCSLSIIPFTTNDGRIAFYNSVFDTTKKVILDRRMAFLLLLSQYIGSSRAANDFWQQLLRVLQTENADIPFALLYSSGCESNEISLESPGLKQTLDHWVLRGLVRVPEPHIQFPRQYSTDEPIEGFLPSFQEMINSDTHTLLLASDGSMPESLVQNLKSANNDDICEAAVFLPIRLIGDSIHGFLILGTNPRKRVDDDYRVFIELLRRQLASSMAAAVLLELEISRSKMAAEYATQDWNLLSKKLAIQTHETSEVESRFRRMADHAPVGMFHFDLSGVVLYANEDYYRLIEHPPNVTSTMCWYRIIMEEDHAEMNREWPKLLDGERVSFELRLKRPFVADEIIGGENVAGSTWIIVSAYAEKDPDGNVVGILGCITNISRQKWAEGVQKRKMLEAIEWKRQQENFIDMTSHEMRNPLSAIVQCADWIGTSVLAFEGNSKDVLLPREILDEYADAAQTIQLCAQHQKRIVDDVLTASKLDSDLLSIAPVEAQPIAIIKSALKMFDGELQKSRMELRFHIESSYSKTSVDWVHVDPSRLLQILINLMTNAIKFTQTESRRKIAVYLGASLERPKGSNSIQYLPRNAAYKDQTADYTSDEVIYLSIAVNDSGRGLDEMERDLLFKRFSQTTPRTHVEYGGSGLGLFVSRQLTEIQGGQIGVASQAGVGSTFAFYVRTRRCPTQHNGLALPEIDSRSYISVLTPARLERIGTGLSLPSSPNEEKKTFGSMHVLIVEDNLVNQKVLSKQLRNAGYVVSVADHGGQALEFLRTTHFFPPNTVPLDIVLMDVEMPVMDGLTCVKKIRELQRTGHVKGHIPVIAVTANARSEQIRIAKEAGMDSAVVKPFRVPELMPEMERVLKEVQEMVRRRSSSRSASAPPF
ncbi:Hybrid signal transduction histidine kinase K [Lachnellula arida]|uniref:Hybrid signal transduction histidine kinase K n=1 Tax=Lachnellula arida TaxID=1316785 RepID=A0A8T9B9B1_9HELO|nr:Hybrid signal transduction histidine kinase K [Lachnellula arida]